MSADDASIMKLFVENIRRQDRDPTTDAGVNGEIDEEVAEETDEEMNEEVDVEEDDE